ncbi:hypothetical protein EJ08DRAFT_739498 [Tothia fuscella]|uniref:Uncharacterized protein n=1 Tax=Tothia fuscella TaxID=1048955 RepID=A0A9P4NE61_9PEZI|nr:hypothetical protein EJ08DRAFT_739498 [Tothia fuscella]
MALVWTTILPIVVFTATSLAQAGPQIKAINPTTAGQIGINTVSVPVPTGLIANIGKNTKYLTNLGGSRTSWIGQGPSFIEVATSTTVTVGGAPRPTTLKNLLLKVDEDSDGTLNILTSPILTTELENLAKGISGCAGAKSRRRQAAMCGFSEFMNRVASSSRISLEGITEALPSAKPLISASDLAKLLSISRSTATSYGLHAAAISGATAMAPVIISYLWLAWNNCLPVIKVALDLQGGGSKTEPENEIKCPTIPYICEDSDCQGVHSKKKCKIQNHKRGCECMFAARPHVDTVDYAWLQAVNEDLMTPVSSGMDTTCDTPHMMAVETKMWLGLVQNFCKSDINKNQSQSLRAAQSAVTGSWDGYARWEFDFAWVDKPGFCDKSCYDIFKKFTDNPLCSFNSHTLTASGTITQDCGIGTFKVTGETITPPPQAKAECWHAGRKFSKNEASPIIEKVCKKAVDHHWHYKVNAEMTAEDAANNKLRGAIFSCSKEHVSLELKADQANCPRGTTMDVRFGSGRGEISAKICKENFMLAVDGCPSGLGGRTYVDCIEWSVGGYE